MSDNNTPHVRIESTVWAVWLASRGCWLPTADGQIAAYATADEAQNEAEEHTGAVVVRLAPAPADHPQ